MKRESRPWLSRGQLRARSKALRGEDELPFNGSFLTDVARPRYYLKSL